MCDFFLSAGGFKYVFPRTRVEPPALGVQIATFCQRKRRAAPDQRNSLELAVFPLALGPCVFALQLLVRAPFFFSFSAASSSFCTSPLPSRSSVICLAQRPIDVGCRQHASLRSDVDDSNVDWNWDLDLGSSIALCDSLATNGENHNNSICCADIAHQ